MGRPSRLPDRDSVGERVTAEMNGTSSSFPEVSSRCLGALLRKREVLLLLPKPALCEPAPLDPAVKELDSPALARAWREGLRLPGGCCGGRDAPSPAAAAAAAAARAEAF